MTTTTKISGATTRLERHVQRWLNDKAQDYNSGPEGVLQDLFTGGCQSGMVSHLIYTVDCVKFFQTHRREISQLLADMLSETGCDMGGLFGDKWDALDPLAQEDANRNLLAWFGFEETARILASRNNIEI